MVLQIDLYFLLWFWSTDAAYTVRHRMNDIQCDVIWMHTVWHLMNATWCDVIWMTLWCHMDDIAWRHMNWTVWCHMNAYSVTSYGWHCGVIWMTQCDIIWMTHSQMDSDQRCKICTYFCFSATKRSLAEAQMTFVLALQYYLHL